MDRPRQHLFASARLPEEEHAEQAPRGEVGLLVKRAHRGIVGDEALFGASRVADLDVARRVTHDEERRAEGHRLADGDLRGLPRDLPQALGRALLFVGIGAADEGPVGAAEVLDPERRPEVEDRVAA